MVFYGGWELILITTIYQSKTILLSPIISHAPAHFKGVYCINIRVGMIKTY